MAPEIHELKKTWTSSSDVTNIANLPRWVKTAIVRRELMGLTWKEAAEPHGRAAQTAANWGASPAGKKWRASIHSIQDDPIQMAGLVLRGTTLEAALDYLAAIDAAKANQDYKEVRLATKDLLATHDLIKPQGTQRSGNVGGVIINVTLPPGVQALEAPEITSDYSIIEAEVEFEDFD